ncbi:hypothetical protein CEXT_589411 [Caerostris extrusa]|uniref:Uncharacterized protein n=1 Tax=Caerostris extrusa TaxID=172846 RepID=A0AAV4QGQ2_CAEEX|nr:hypothetical protein CEXT_589411 [Caerostris extrusa]
MEQGVSGTMPGGSSIARSQLLGQVFECSMEGYKNKKTTQLHKNVFRKQINKVLQKSEAACPVCKNEVTPSQRKFVQYPKQSNGDPQKLVKN